MKPKTQIDAIKQHLKTRKSITPKEAVNLYDCWRLSAQIHKLRDEGMDIYTKRVGFKNRWGKGNYAKYLLA